MLVHRKAQETGETGSQLGDQQNTLLPAALLFASTTHTAIHTLVTVCTNHPLTQMSESCRTCGLDAAPSLELIVSHVRLLKELKEAAVPKRQMGFHPDCR